jgi:membrane peptidoglycan carboxypeptidase
MDYSQNYVPPYMIRQVMNMTGKPTLNQVFAKLPLNEQAALLERQATIVNEMMQKIKETEEFIKYHMERTVKCSSAEWSEVKNDEPFFEEENVESNSNQFQLNQ